MAALKAVIEALHRELLAAFPEETGSGPVLKPRKITLQLEVLATDTAAGRTEISFNARSSQTGQKNSGFMTIEMDLEGSKGLASHLFKTSSAGSNTPNLPQTTPAHSNDIFVALSEALGAPGFDSSARAAVLHETLSELSPQDAQAALTTLAGKPEAGTSEPLLRAQRQLRRILEKGPAGLARGTQALRQALEAHARETVLEEIQRTWKTVETWMTP